MPVYLLTGNLQTTEIVKLVNKVHYAGFNTSGIISYEIFQFTILGTLALTCIYLVLLRDWKKQK